MNIVDFIWNLVLSTLVFDEVGSTFCQTAKEFIKFCLDYKLVFYSDDPYIGGFY